MKQNLTLKKYIVISVILASVIAICLLATPILSFAAGVARLPPPGVVRTVTFTNTSYAPSLNLSYSIISYIPIPYPTVDYEDIPLAFNPNGTLLYISGPVEYGNVLVMNPITNNVVNTISIGNFSPAAYIDSIAMDPVKSIAYVVHAIPNNELYHDHTYQTAVIAVIDLNSNTIIHSIQLPVASNSTPFGSGRVPADEDSVYSSVVISPDGTTAYIGESNTTYFNVYTQQQVIYNNSLFQINISTSNITKIITLPPKCGGVNTPVFDPNGNVLYLLCNNITVMDAHSGAIIGSINITPSGFVPTPGYPGFAQPVSITFNPSGTLAYVKVWYGTNGPYFTPGTYTIEVVNVSQGKVVNEFNSTYLEKQPGQLYYDAHDNLLITTLDGFSYGSIIEAINPTTGKDAGLINTGTVGQMNSSRLFLTGFLAFKPNTSVFYDTIGNRNAIEEIGLNFTTYGITQFPNGCVLIRNISVPSLAKFNSKATTSSKLFSSKTLISSSSLGNYTNLTVGAVSVSPTSAIVRINNSLYSLPVNQLQVINNSGIKLINQTDGNVYIKLLNITNLKNQVLTCGGKSTNFPVCNLNSTTQACTNSANNYPFCTTNSTSQTCVNGASNYPTCNYQGCTNSATNYPSCTFSSATQTCLNNQTNYPTCSANPSKVCTNGANNFPYCTIVTTTGKCINGATNYPDCNSNINIPPPTCTNGANDYPYCYINTISKTCLDGATNYPDCFLTSKGNLNNYTNTTSSTRISLILCPYNNNTNNSGINKVLLGIPGLVGLIPVLQPVPGIPFTLRDQQYALSYVQNTKSLDYLVTATVQPVEDHGYAYLINGLSNKNYWYQVGISSSWQGSPPNVFQFSYEMFKGSQSVFPRYGGLGNTNFDGVVNEGDTIDIQLRFKQQTDGSTIIVMSAKDENTGAYAEMLLPAYGATTFIGQSFVSPGKYPVSVNGQFTGPMTEWYHANSYGGPSSEVTYITPSAKSVPSWMILDQYCTDGTTSTIACIPGINDYSVASDTPVTPPPVPAYTTYFTDGFGAAFYSTGEFVTGLENKFELNVENLTPEYGQTDMITSNGTFTTTDHMDMYAIDSTGTKTLLAQSDTGNLTYVICGTPEQCLNPGPYTILVNDTSTRQSATQDIQVLYGQSNNSSTCQSNAIPVSSFIGTGGNGKEVVECECPVTNEFVSTGMPCPSSQMCPAGSQFLPGSGNSSSNCECPVNQLISTGTTACPSSGRSCTNGQSLLPNGSCGVRGVQGQSCTLSNGNPGIVKVNMFATTGSESISCIAIGSTCLNQYDEFGTYSSTGSCNVIGAPCTTSGGASGTYDAAGVCAVPGASCITSNGGVGSFTSVPPSFPPKCAPQGESCTITTVGPGYGSPGILDPAGKCIPASGDQACGLVGIGIGFFDSSGQCINPGTACTMTNAEPGIYDDAGDCSASACTTLTGQTGVLDGATQCVIPNTACSQYGVPSGVWNLGGQCVSVTQPTTCTSGNALGLLNSNGACVVPGDACNPSTPGSTGLVDSSGNCETVTSPATPKSGGHGVFLCDSSNNYCDFCNAGNNYCMVGEPVDYNSSVGNCYQAGTC